MAETNTKLSCQYCKFFIGGLAIGTCKRFPKTENKHKNDWCGEYSASENALSEVPAHPVNTGFKVIWSEPKVQEIELQALKAPEAVYDINTDAMVSIAETITAEPTPEAPKKRGRPKK